MKPWLRKNWIGLVAVAVLLPATLGITFSQEWTGYFASWPSAPIEVADGENPDYGGAGWELDGVERIAASTAEGAEIGLPAGTDLVVATLRVQPAEFDEEGLSTRCTIRLQELDGDSEVRSFGDAYLDPIEYRAPVGVQSGCNSALAAPYLTQITFIVPSDAGTGGTRLGMSVSVVDELPDFLRFTL